MSSLILPLIFMFKQVLQCNNNIILYKFMNLFFHYPKIYNSSFHPILVEQHSRIQNRRNNPSIWRNNEKSETATSCVPVTVAITRRINDCPVGSQLCDEQNILLFLLFCIRVCLSASIGWKDEL